METDGKNNCCIPPTLDGWVYIEPIHEPLYTWAQYTPTLQLLQTMNFSCILLARLWKKLMLQTPLHGNLLLDLNAGSEIPC